MVYLYDFGLYILTPIIRIYVKNSDLNNLRYFIFIWFMANGVFHFIQEIWNIKIGVDLSFFLGFVGYYILGYYLHIITLNNKQINFMYFLSIIGFVAAIFGTYILTKNNDGVLNEAFYEPLSPNVILMSSGVFIFIKNYNWNDLIGNQKVIMNKINIYNIAEFSSLSFGIYLIHVLILEIISLGFLPIKIDAMFINPVIGIPFTAILTLLISYYIIKTLKRYFLSRFIM